VCNLHDTSVHIASRHAAQEQDRCTELASQMLDREGCMFADKELENADAKVLAARKIEQALVADEERTV
jgi:hypothetical protein